MKTADKIIHGGKIHTMEEGGMPEAVAVSGKRIVFTGSFDEAMKFSDENTNIIDLGGACMYPGFTESYVHVPGNAYNVLFNFDLSHACTVDETMKIIRDFIEANPEKQVYFGRGFKTGIFPEPENGAGPRKERLDEICSSKPVVIADSASHIRWLNSKAFEMFGITEDTEVDGGVVEKDSATGKLWGTLKEEAKYLVPEQKFTHDENKAAFSWMQEMLGSCGYTSMMALRPSPSSELYPMMDIISECEKEGGLHIRMVCAREIKPNIDIDTQLEDMCEKRKIYKSENTDIAGAKFFIDGTVDAATAYLKEQYEKPAGREKGYRGEILWEKERLSEAFEKTMKKGFDIHIHAIGDGAVEFSVDCLEKAQKATDVSLKAGGSRSVITHLQLVGENEKRRMAELGIIACINPYWHYKEPGMYDMAELPFLGRERVGRENPVASLADKGVMLICASDHPITPVPNPMYAIQAAVTRNFYTPEDIKKHEITSIDDECGLLNRSERISVDEILKALTINGARALGLENETDSIKVGNMRILL